MEEWEDAFFFIERNGKALCLICNTMISHFKASNLQRHFSTLHANIDKELPKGTELICRRLLKTKDARNPTEIIIPSLQQGNKKHLTEHVILCV